MITGRCRTASSPLIRSSTSNPSIPGISMSSRTTSGGSSRIAARASAPSVAEVVRIPSSSERRGEQPSVQRVVVDDEDVPGSTLHPHPPRRPTRPGPDGLDVLAPGGAGSVPRRPRAVGNRQSARPGDRLASSLQSAHEGRRPHTLRSAGRGSDRRHRHAGGGGTRRPHQDPCHDGEPDGLRVPRREAVLRAVLQRLRRPKATTLGCEFAGAVETVGGSVTSFEVGDEVFGFNEWRYGGHAEYLSMPEDGDRDHAGERDVRGGGVQHRGFALRALGDQQGEDPAWAGRARERRDRRDRLGGGAAPEAVGVTVTAVCDTGPGSWSGAWAPTG